MKTDLVEIFQTIRAALQPYAVLGFSNRNNSDTLYDLWSEKNMVVDGTKRTETFFGSVSIESDYVLVRTGFEHNGFTGHADLQVSALDDMQMSEIEEIFAAGYKTFKENEWV